MDETAVGSKVRESTLPGVGKKYVMPLEAGGNIALIVRPDGERSLFHFLQDEDQPCDVVKFNRDEAQQVANLMAPALVAPPDLEGLELALGSVEIEWIELGSNSQLVGATLGSSGLRERTGASVVAVMRDGTWVANPDVDFNFRRGDTVLVLGNQEQCEAARQLMED